MNAGAVIQRIDELLARESPGNVPEFYFSTLSVAVALYGEESSLVQEFKKHGAANPRAAHHASMGFLLTMKTDLEAGLIGSIRLGLTGAVLADLLAMARACLDEANDEGFLPGAVLAAAAFEDTLRRLAAERLSLVDRIELNEVLKLLKEAKIIADTQHTVAQSYLPFRNRALHADWVRVDRATTAAVLAFVQELIGKHFS